MLKLCLPKKIKVKKRSQGKASNAQAETLRKSGWRLVLGPQKLGGNEESLLLVVDTEESFC